MCGDNIVATPMIRNIAKAIPNDAKIFYLTREYAYPILKNNPYISNFILYDKFYDESKHGSFLAWLKLIFILRKDNFDLIIDTAAEFLRIKRTLIPLLAGSKYRAGFRRGRGFRGLLNTHEAEYKINLHQASLLLVLISCLGIKPVDNFFEIYPDRSDNEYINGLLEKNLISEKDLIVVLHAANKNENKLWDKDKFAKLADLLYENLNARIIFTGDNSDLLYIEDLAKKIKNKVWIFAGKTTLTQLAVLISRSKLLVTLDTSCVHIASASNTPTVALYGQTYSNEWLPWNTKTQVAITEHDKCNGCSQGNYLNRIICSDTKENVCRYNYECIRNIEINKVFEAAKQLAKL